MEIKRNGSQPSIKGLADWFTGTVRIDNVSKSKRSGPRDQRQRHLRTGRPNSLAYPPVGPDPDCHGRLRPGPLRGRAGRGDPSRRCSLDPAR